jgi:hypothetical protein
MKMPKVWQLFGNALPWFRSRRPNLDANAALPWSSPKFVDVEEACAHTINTFATAPIYQKSAKIFFGTLRSEAHVARNGASAS